MHGNYSLVREMMQTPSVISGFRSDRVRNIRPGVGPVLLAGEGSSRLFPAKRAVAEALRSGRTNIITEGCTQALEYDLSGYTVYVASNSGRTAEAVRLISVLKSRAGADRVYGIAGHGDSPVMDLADGGVVLECGTEEAVAASKSVVEQALIYNTIFGSLVNPAGLGEAFETALTGQIPRSVLDAAAAADTIYFAGRNDGVAEELTLKTNEIARKKSDFLEGTYAVHGIEEVMVKRDLAVLVDPYPEEEQKFHDVLVTGLGMTVVAIADRETRFPTIRIPSLPGAGPYLQLAAGWNLLVETGMALGIDLDTPVRARKVGNEFTG